MAQPGDSMAAAAPGHLRASHADRERVIGALSTAFASGLLTKAGFDLGVHRTLASRTYADLAAATATLRAQPLTKPPMRPANAAASGACGLIVTSFLTMVIVPSGTTVGMVGVTAAVIYGIFWLLAGILMLASRYSWPLSARHGPDDKVRLGAAGHRVRQRRPRGFVG
jgi:hypothetical protein